MTASLPAWTALTWPMWQSGPSPLIRQRQRQRQNVQSSWRLRRTTECSCAWLTSQSGGQRRCTRGGARQTRGSRERAAARLPHDALNAQARHPLPSLSLPLAVTFSHPCFPSPAASCCWALCSPPTSYGVPSCAAAEPSWPPAAAAAPRRGCPAGSLLAVSSAASPASSSTSCLQYHLVSVSESPQRPPVRHGPSLRSGGREPRCLCTVGDWLLVCICLQAADALLPATGRAASDERTCPQEAVARTQAGALLGCRLLAPIVAAPHPNPKLQPQPHPAGCSAVHVVAGGGACLNSQLTMPAGLTSQRVRWGKPRRLRVACRQQAGLAATMSHSHQGKNGAFPSHPCQLHATSASFFLQLGFLTTSTNSMLTSAGAMLRGSAVALSLGRYVGTYLPRA